MIEKVEDPSSRIQVQNLAVHSGHTLPSHSDGHFESCALCMKKKLGHDTSYWIIFQTLGIQSHATWHRHSQYAVVHMTYLCTWTSRHQRITIPIYSEASFDHISCIFTLGKCGRSPRFLLLYFAPSMRPCTSGTGQSSTMYSQLPR
jgi:hypothetical protein